MRPGGRRLVLVALTIGCWLSYPIVARSQASAPVPRPAGDLSAIRTIAVDALQLVRSGEVAQARARVEQIEAQWRPLESKLKSTSPAKWKAIDEAIDRAERELRFWRVRRTDSAAALQNLIDAIDSHA